jgi:type II secretory pathway component PulM
MSLIQNQHPPLTTMRKSSVRRVLLWGAASLALVLVFFAYLQPHMALALANQLWNCF